MLTHILNITGETASEQLAFENQWHWLIWHKVLFDVEDKNE